MHSPVELDDDLRDAMADIGGDVKHIVSPNYEHVKFAKQWIDAFPSESPSPSPRKYLKKNQPAHQLPIQCTTHFYLHVHIDAAAYGCPGAMAKYPDIGYKQEVPTSAGEMPPGWPKEVEAVWFDCEKNPFTGKPFFNEVNFV